MEKGTKITVDLVSGFLGAGKTTLISKYAASLIKKGEIIAIIENEFGEFGIDGYLLKNEGLSVTEIANGCICCTMKGDFISVLEDLSKDKKIDRIIIEPTGLLIFEDIYDALNSYALKKSLELRGIVTVVDAISFKEQRHKYSMFFEQQILNANKIILSKTESLDRIDVIDTIDILSKIAPHTEVVAKNLNTLNTNDFDYLFEPKNTHRAHDGNHHCDYNNCIGKSHHHLIHTSHKMFESISVDCTKSFSKQELDDVLKEISTGCFGDIPRAKGFVPNSYDGSWLFNLVEKQINITHQKAKNTTNKANFIGIDIKRNSITELFGQ